MNKKLVIGNSRVTITIKPSDYLAAGGEAEVYTNGGMVYKLYHDPDHKMLPIQKIQELGMITDPQVVVPKDVIYDAQTNKPLGYNTKFIDKADPILKLFNRAYKTTNNIDSQMVADLVKKMQQTLSNIHSAKCLAVDFNELNILISLGTELSPWFIDTDSYATPSFKATAIMDSVRDRKASVYDSKGIMHYNPTVLSDWFSWAVISFWIYSNVHPYRGNHPNYKPKDRLKQMDDGISVFHKDVKVPPTVENFNVIPPRHLDWFKLVFTKDERSIPPLPDSNVPLLVPSQIVTITGTDKLTIEQVAACGSSIISVQQIMGVNYVVSQRMLYSGNNEVRPHDPKKKVLFCAAQGGSMVSATKYGDHVEFAELYSGTKLDTLKSSDIFERNGAIYSVVNGGLIESTFRTLGTKLIHTSKSIENVSSRSAKIYSGCVIQDLLGKKYLTLPYALGKSFSKYLPGLDSVRIIDAKSDKNVTVIIGEEKGKYNRYVVVFDKKYTAFEIRVDVDVVYEPINFAVMDNGLCLLLASDQIQLFASAQQYETLDNPPFDASMPLFATPSGFFFINGNTIHRIKRK
jgi:hypothetical protein